MLSVALMGHPSRQPFIDWLVPQLPGVEVVLDEKNDRWDTGRRSLLAFDPAASHHMVIQDDALPCRDLVPGAAAAAEAAGARPVGLYVGRVRPHQHTVTPAVRKALAAGVPWIEMRGPFWGVAIIVPTADIPELISWGDRNPQIKNYDRRVAAWYERRGIHCWYTVPSLVDHRPVAENPSLIRGRTGDRRAHDFLGDRSALELDWSREPVSTVDPTVAFQHVRTGAVRRVPRGSGRERALERNHRWERVQPGGIPLQSRPLTEAR